METIATEYIHLMMKITPTQKKKNPKYTKLTETMGERQGDSDNEEDYEDLL